MWSRGFEAGDRPPSSLQEEEEELKDQFQQQQEKIVELKELLKQNEQKLVNKEKEVEQYATKLSDIKSRSKASKRKSAKSEHEPQEPKTPIVGSHKEEISTPGRGNTEKTPKGNLVLLRKKLEENRLKFEQRGKEISENKKGIEEMVQHLKTQLDERDLTIQELQRGLQSTHSPARVTEPQEMKEHITISAEYSSQTPEEISSQIVYRDNRIMELNSRITQMEATILDLEETVREKDSVIDARTKAITLMSEDFSRRSKVTIDNLEETREEMRKMQNNFVLQEVKMKEENRRLKEELAAKHSRLLQAEESVKTLESIRFDLSTRNAELQEKVVKVQEQIRELHNRPVEEPDNTRVEDLTVQLDSANKQIVKLKAQHKTKVKNLTKQLDGLKQMSDANEEIVKLQNRVAELEEDKGNLQLHLVDFDELKVSESHLQTRVSELEERVLQQNQDLDSHVHMIALLEAEKLEHMQDICSEKKKISNLESELEGLKTCLQELENQKVSLEMKTVDLEEQIDILTKEKAELLEEIKEISFINQGVEGSVDTAKVENDSDTSCLLQSVELVERQEEEKELVAETQDMNVSLEQLRAELLNSNKIIEEQKEIIMDLKSKIDSRDEELEMQNEVITRLEQLGDYSDRDDKIAEIVAELREVAADLEEWKSRCTEVEKRLQDLGEEKMGLEERFKEVKSENSLLNQELVEQRDIAADLASKLKEQSNAITGRDEKISSLQNLIEINGHALEAREMTLKDVHERLNSVEKQFELRLSELKLTLADKAKELLDLTSALAKQKSILADKETQITELNETLQKQSHEFASLQQQLLVVEENVFCQFRVQLDEISSTLAQKDELNCQLAEECHHHKHKIDMLTAEVEDKVQYIMRLEVQTEELKEFEQRWQLAESSLKICEEELCILKQDLALKQSEVEDKMDKLGQVEGKVIELTEKNKKFIANLKTKAVTIKGHEQKLQQYEAVVQAKENLISELKAQNEKLLEQQADKANLDQQLKMFSTLTEELNDEQSRTEMLGDELVKAADKIMTLESELKASGAKIEELLTVEENCMALTTKVSELEQEIIVIQVELRNKDEQIMMLENDKVRLIEEGKAKEQEEVNKSSGFKDKIEQLETELVTLRTERLEKLEAEKEELLQQVLSATDSIAKVCELEEWVKSRDQIITELQEQLMSSSERNQQSLSAVEAKLQEREAVVESLEQELLKSTGRMRHLEEGLAFVEERRQSLENTAETLSFKLQESDRVKEEAFENEEMLEQRLTILITSEENLKKRFEILNRANEESAQRVAELTAENVNLRKEVVNTESIMKGLQKELERLLPFEYSHVQASEKVETLEAELKRVVIELEHRMKEKVHEAQQHVENLETDLRNVNIQLEHVELEKKTLMEQYEKLNDERISLEDEIERLNQAAEIYKHTNADLKEQVQEKLSVLENTISEKELARKELEEKFQSLETELQGKTSESKEKECVIIGMNEKIQVLETELKMVSSAVDTAALQKEEIKNKLSERIAHLEKELETTVSSFETAAVEKDRIHSELQGTIRSQEAELKQYQHMLEATVSQPHTETDSGVCRIVSEEHIASLNAELNQLELSLIQKDNEIKSYQTRLLQLQFGNAQDGGHDTYASLQDKTSHLEESNISLQETIHVRDSQISDLNTALTASNTELGQLLSELQSSHTKVEELIKQVNILEDETVNKNNYIEQLQATFTETQAPASPPLDSITQEYEMKLSSLKKHNDELFHELLEMRAQQEVADIVRLAEEQVLNINTLSVDPDNGSKSVKFQEPVQAQSVSTNMEIQVKALEEELQLMRSERDAALLRIMELSSRIPPYVSETVLMLQDAAEMSVIEDSIEVDRPWQQTDRSQTVSEVESFVQKDSSVDTVQQVVAPETVVSLGSSSWGVGVEGEGEEWGWGSEEAHLEEEHMQKQKEALLHTETSDVLKDRIVTLEKHITNVQAEKENLIEELRTAQVRSGKMLKKLKDLKLKNDSLLKENLELAQKLSAKNFGDLDQAIEEELKIRIDSLEKELREMRNEKDTACSEKERLENHVDMLTCANERFVEMKERQDIDMEVWKQKNRDLSNQVQSLEWRIGELIEENKSVLESNAGGEQDVKESFFSWDKHGFTPDSRHLFDIESLNNELQEKVSALSVDNENLQGLLEQQRNLRLAAETELQEIQQRMSHTDAGTQFCSEENSNLKEKLQLETQEKTLEELRKECGRLDEKNNNLQSAYHALKTEYERVCKESEECILATERKYEALQCEYAKKIEDINNGRFEIEEYYRNVLEERDQVIEDVEKLSKNIADLTQQHEALKLEYSNLREHTVMQEKTLAFADKHKSNLECELAQLKSENVSSGLSDTSGLLSEQKMRIVQLEMELQSKTEETERLCQLNESQKLEQAQVEQEWNGKVERLRKELELSAEDLYKQRDRYSMLMKEYQELRDHSSEMIQCHVQEAMNTKEKEIESMKAQLKEKETQFFVEIEGRSKEDSKYKLVETSDLLTTTDRDIEILKFRLTQKEKEIEDISSIKDKDIQNLKIMLSENEHKFEEALGQKEQDIYNLRVLLADSDAKISELEQTLNEEVRQLTELRELVEDRELEVRQLKDELIATRSKAAQALSVLPAQPYDSLNSSVTGENQSSVEENLDWRGQNDSNASDIQQGELDQALYMLHQRDVRCDELTLELMQLLEERDTLQLRLSNALRVNEELRAKNRTSAVSSPDITADQLQSRQQMPQNIEAVISSPPSLSTTVQEPQEDLQALSNKLSQLRNVGYRRDVTLQDEREQRHNEQMRLLHQRGSGIVVDASYTLSRDVQSPSTVLLNWIWGRSTPRVMHV